MTSWAILILLFLVNAFTSSLNLADSNKNSDLIEQKNSQNLIYDELEGENNEFIAKLMNQHYEKRNSLNQLVFIEQELVKKDLSLSFISGIEKSVPNGSSMKYFNQPTIETIQSTNIYLDAFYSLDWSKIFIYVLSFVIICFSFDAFSGEKEGGTLKLILSNSISRISIVLGKYFGLLIIFIIPLAIGFIFEILIVLTNPEMSFPQGTLPKILLFMLSGFIFISINIFLGYLISCLSRNSAASLSICLVVWTILSVIFPNVGWLGVSQSKPVPTIANVNENIIQLTRNLDNCFMGWNSAWEGRSPNEQVISRKECSDRRTQLENGIWYDYYQKLFSQTETAINISCFSPFSSFRFLCDKIADNGYFGYKSFYNEVRDYQNEFRSFINFKDQADESSYHLIWNEESMGKTFMSNQYINPNEIPRFRFRPSPLILVLQSAAWNISFLLIWCAMLFLGVIRVFNRYDVR